MEKRNGMVGKEEGDPICHRRFFSISRYRPINWMVVLGACSLVGCTTIKKAGITSLATAGGATVATALSGGVAAPILGGTTGAFVGSVVTDMILDIPGRKCMTNCAPDNFWSLLGSVIEMGGWALILIVVVPMIFSWLLPGPIKFKGKDK